MKTYRGTVCVTYYQDITVEAETQEEAEMQMYQRFDIAKAECGRCEAYDVEELTKEGD